VEIWRDIARLEGKYKVSSKGRIKSLSRQIYAGRGRYRTTLDRILKPGVIGKGYLQVHLSDGRRGYDLLVARIVAVTFIPNPTDLPEVNHINGNKLDCSVENLEWIDHSGNMKHAVNSGLMPDRRGKNSSGAVLSEEQVREARRRRIEGESYTSIASAMGVLPVTISRAINGKSWTNL
jgi:hypothetical protein